MLEVLSPKDKNVVIYTAIAIIAIFLSGIFLAIAYFGINAFHTTLQTVTCDLPGTNYGDCQTWFQDTIYKLFALKPIIIVFSYLFIFSLVGGMLVLGYKNGQNPVMMGVILVMSIIFTYVGIGVSNIYRELLTNTYFYDMMLPFTIYNKIMLNFPWFIGLVGLASLVLSIVNFQRARVNTPTSDLNY